MTIGFVRMNKEMKFMLRDYTLNKETPVPLYFQLKTLLLDRIKDGSYRPGDLIPTENELSTMFDISRTTVRQAVTELVREGYLYRIKSKGTFVSKPKVTQRVLNRYYSYADAAKSAGRETRIVILKMEVIPMPQNMIDMGAGAPGDKAIYLYRKRLSNGEPLMRVESYMAYDKFADLLDADLERNTLRQLMDRNPETRVHKMNRTIEAVPANMEDINVLEVDAGSAIQMMTTIRYNEAGEFLDIGCARYRGDMSRIEVEIVQPAEEHG